MGCNGGLNAGVSTSRLRPPGSTLTLSEPGGGAAQTRRAQVEHVRRRKRGRVGWPLDTTPSQCVWRVRPPGVRFMDSTLVGSVGEGLTTGSNSKAARDSPLIHRCVALTAPDSPPLAAIATERVVCELAELRRQTQGCAQHQHPGAPPINRVCRPASRLHERQPSPPTQPLTVRLTARPGGWPRVETNTHTWLH